jgi:hypothetical protein
MAGTFLQVQRPPSRRQYPSCERPALTGPERLARIFHPRSRRLRVERFVIVPFGVLRVTRSTRQRLKAGDLPHVQNELTAALEHIQDASKSLSNAHHGEDQINHTRDNGGLLEILYLVGQLIRAELPNDGKCTTCGRVRGGP